MCINIEAQQGSVPQKKTKKPETLKIGPENNLGKVIVELKFFFWNINLKFINLSPLPPTEVSSDYVYSKIIRL